jgi:hypothetical protein
VQERQDAPGDGEPKDGVQKLRSLGHDKVIDRPTRRLDLL